MSQLNTHATLHSQTTSDSRLHIGTVWETDKFPDCHASESTTAKTWLRRIILADGAAAPAANSADDAA